MIAGRETGLRPEFEPWPAGRPFARGSMAQVFHPVFNTVSRVTIFGAVFFMVGALWALMKADRSDYRTGLGVALVQPVPSAISTTSTGIGLDCRYCHWPVESGPFAGIPATEVCMGCHAQIWSDSPAARARAREPPHRDADPLESRSRPAGLRPLRSQHSRQEGRGLRHVPRPDRPDAGGDEGGVAPDGMVPGVPSRPRQARRPGGRRLQHDASEDLSPEKATLHTAGMTDCSLCHQ